MTTIFNPAHAHYAVHKAYVEGCFAAPDDPPVVQVLPGLSVWLDAEQTNWFEHVPHRIKPRTITRLVTYPEPMRGAPEAGSQVWHVSGEYDRPYKTTWTNTQWLRLILKNGMCFETESYAQECYDALFKD